MVERIAWEIDAYAGWKDEFVVGVREAEIPHLVDAEGFVRESRVEFVDVWAPEHVRLEIAAGHHPPLLSEDPSEMLRGIVPD
jgi:hypothetical protein